MLGFFAEAGPDEPQVGDELEDARWFTFDEVDAALRCASPEGGLLLSPSVSIPRWLVEYWHGAMAAQGRGARRHAAASYSGPVHHTARRRRRHHPRAPPPAVRDRGAPVRIVRGKDASG